MPRLTRFEIEHQTLSKALDRRTSSLAKLASEGTDAIRKYAADLTAHVLGEYQSRLRKGTASAADMSAIMKRAAAEYRASSPSPLAEVENEIGVLEERMEKMRASFPAWKRQVLHGIDDPNGIDVRPPGYDPTDPIRNFGGARIAEKSFTVDPSDGSRSAPKFTPFAPIGMPQQEAPRDLAAGALDAALNHQRLRRD
jgi:hypothetical protein